MTSINYAGTVTAVRKKRVIVELTMTASSDIRLLGPYRDPAGSHSTVILPAFGGKFRPGDPVVITVEEKLPRFVFFTAILPVVFFNVLLVIFRNGTGNLQLSWIMALLSLSPYFACIWAIREKILLSVVLRGLKGKE